MNIAIFTDSFLPQINGVVSYVIDTAGRLVEHGHEVTVFAPRPRRGVNLKKSEFPFKLELLPSLPALVYPDLRVTVPSIPKIFMYLRRAKTDIVHIQDPLTVGFDGLISARILKIPSVITFHTFFMDEEMLKNLRLGEKVASLIKSPLWHLTSYYHNLADAVICPSKIAQKELVSYGLEKPSVLIPNGIDLKNIRSISKDEIIRKRLLYQVSRSDRVGIYVGRLSVDKSLPILLKSWKLVCHKFPSAKLLIVGGGPAENNLRILVRNLSLTHNVVFTGRMDRAQILSDGIFNLADVFLTASKIENQSIAIIEAMAHGLPIIGVDMRGMPELVGSSNGILVSPDNPEIFAAAVTRLFSNKNETKRLAAGSLAKAQNYDLENTVSQLEKLFKGLITHKKSSQKRLEKADFK